MSQYVVAGVPRLHYKRSRQDLSHGVKTSANVGTLYPFDVEEVYPGDTFKDRSAFVTRLSSQFIRPVMDNLFLDTYWFYVPSRLVLDGFPQIFGENRESAWVSAQEYAVPTIIAKGSAPELGVDSKTVADYLGLPLGTFSRPVSVLPFRAFAKIYDDWFRDENIIPPMHIQKGFETGIEVGEYFNNEAWAPNNYFGMCPKVSRMHDYFSSALPAPQKGDPVNLPLGSSAPVNVGVAPGTFGTPVFPVRPLDGQSYVTTSSPPPAMRMERTDHGVFSDTNSFSVSSTGDVLVNEGGSVGGQQVYPENLVAELSSNGLSSTLKNRFPVFSADLSQATAANINDIRMAFQIQRMLERDAMGGTRYNEYLRAHFGVDIGDARIQRSEFLGGRRSPLTIQQVTQTTGSGDDSSPLGELGAYSLSNSRTRYTKSFAEHGYVIGVFCIRQHHTYQQGIRKMWTRSKRLDFFDPVFDYIGNQPIYTTELFASAPVDQVFGYQEAWADLRNHPNHITGQMRTAAPDSLDVWHFGDYYSNAPTLNSQWLLETPTYVDRAITVDSSVQDQFILDIWINRIAYRRMSTYSMPGLIDHN